MGTSRGSERIRTTSAVSIATSVPAPIAMPRSAWASAGASLTPSPTIATRLPAACSSATLAALSAGQHLGDDGVDAQLVGDPLGGGLVVPGEHDDLHPGLVQGGDGRGGGVPGGVGQGDHGDGAAVDGDQHRGPPGRGQLVAAADQRADVDALVGHQRAGADQDPAAVDLRDRAVAGDVAEPGRRQHRARRGASA